MKICDFRTLFLEIGLIIYISVTIINVNIVFILLICFTIHFKYNKERDVFMDELNINKEILIDSPVASLWYYPESKIIHHKFKKFIYGEDLKNLLVTGAEYFEKKGCKKWLSDDRKSSALRKADLEWGENNCQKRMDALLYGVVFQKLKSQRPYPLSRKLRVQIECNLRRYAIGLTFFIGCHISIATELSFVKYGKCNI